MEFLKVYRGVVDISPIQLEDFHAAKYEAHLWNNVPEENRVHTAGDGMYFAFNKSDAEHYVRVRQKQSHGLVGKYLIKGDYKVFDDQNIDNTDMQKLHNLLEKIEEQLNQAFDKKMIKLNGRLIPDLSEAELEELNKEENSLLALKNKTVKAIHDLRKSFDISIYQYQEVCIHNPQVQISLQSIDLHCQSEEVAKQIFQEIKSGQLSGDKIIDIDPSLSSYLDNILKNIKQA